MGMPLHTPEYKKFLEILVRARVEKNVSQIELSKRLGKTQQFVSRCEVGERRLDVVEFYKWCEALGVDGQSMFGSFGAWLRTSKLEQLS